MSSPRGLALGGICAITVCDELLTRRVLGLWPPGGRFSFAVDVLLTALSGAGDGRSAAGSGSMSQSPPRARRTLKYMFNGRSDLFE